MSLCPVCGKYLCDHTPSERGQTQGEMERPLNKEELAILQQHPSQEFSSEKLAVAQKNAHLE